MPTQVVTQLIVDASGVKQTEAQFVASMEKMKKAAVDAGTTTATSFERAQQRWTQSLGTTDPVIKAQIAQQQALARQQAVNDQAVKLGIATQAAANAQLDRVRQKYQEHIDSAQRAQLASTRFGQALTGVTGQLVALSAGLGPVGVALASMGPWGLAAAAGIGVFEHTLGAVSQAVKRFADEMGRLRDSAQIIGLNTMQLQAVNDEGAEFALTEDKIATALQRFSAQMDEARRGQGELFTQMQRIDPALALQLARTTGNAAAMDIYAAALARAGTSQAALSRAGFGRAGFDVGQLLTSIANKGGIDAITESFRQSGDAIDRDMIEKVRVLKREIDDMAGDAQRNLASIFSVQLLEHEREFYSLWRDFSRAAKEFSLSGDWDKFVSDISSQRLLGGLAALTAALPSISLVFKSLQIMGMLKGALPDMQRHGLIGAAALAVGRMDPAAAARQAEGALPRATTPIVVASPVVPLPQPRPASAPQDTAEATERQAQLDLNLYRQRIALLGDAATAGEQYRLRVLQINAAVAQNADLEQFRGRALAAANAAMRAEVIQATVSALGSAATVTEQYNAKVAQLTSQLATGKINQETFNRAVGGLHQEESIRALSDMVSALGEVATPMEQYRLRVAQLQQQLDQGRISQETFNRAVIGANPYFKELKDSATEFTKTFASGILDGKSAIESLAAAMDNLAKKMLESGINNILSGLATGNLVQAGVGAVQTVGAFVVKALAPDAELKKAQENWKGMADQVRAFNEAARGVDLQPLTQELRQSWQTAAQLFKAAWDARDFAGAAAVGNDYKQLVKRTLDEFAAGAPVLDEFGQRLKDAIDTAAQLAEEAARHPASGVGFAEAQAKTAEGLKRIAEQIGTDFTADLQSKINEALGKGYLNQIGDLVTQRQQQLANIEALRAQGVNVDPGMIDRYFAVQAQKIIDDANLVGSGFDDLIARFGDLNGIVHQSTAAIEAQAEEQRRLRDELNQTARSILDYVHGLLGGSQSQLSPQARLAAAQSAYNSQILLAQGGNLQAQQSITQYAEDLRTAAQAMFASSTGYQAIFNQITTDLLALPAVQQADDPTVVALRDVLTAINAGNATQALDTTLQSTIKNAIDAGNASSIAALLVPKFDTLNQTTATGLTFTDFVAGLGPSYAALAKDATAGMLLTKAQIEALGLSKDATISALDAGNLLKIFQELDNNGNGIIEKEEAIKAASQGINTNTALNADIKAAVEASKTLNDAIKAATEGMRAWGAAGVLDAIKDLQNTSKDQLVLLKDSLTGSAVVTVSPPYPAFTYKQAPTTDAWPTTLQNSLIVALNKIVWNTYAIAHNTAVRNFVADNASHIFGSYAQGGLAPANTLAIFAEHSGRPQMMRTTEPTFFAPGYPQGFANDNSAVVAELRALRADNLALRNEVTALRAEVRNGNGTREKMNERDEEWRIDEKRNRPRAVASR